MESSIIEFVAWDRNHGDHKAVTYTFSSLKERDEKAKSLAKGSRVLYVKKKDVPKFDFVHYTATVHYGEKDDAGKDWASYGNE